MRLHLHLSLQLYVLTFSSFPNSEVALEEKHVYVMTHQTRFIYGYMASDI